MPAHRLCRTIINVFKGRHRFQYNNVRGICTLLPSVDRLTRQKLKRNNRTNLCHGSNGFNIYRIFHPTQNIHLISAWNILHSTPHSRPQDKPQQIQTSPNHTMYLFRPLGNEVGSQQAEKLQEICKYLEAQ